jgi:hypothetical protein
MVPQVSLTVMLVDLINAIPSPPRQRRRGHPPVYPDRLFLKSWWSCWCAGSRPSAG